jgi:hypothetical protein
VGVPYESLLVLLAGPGDSLDADALTSLEDVRPSWVRVEREGTSSCLAARVCHAEPPGAFRDRVRRWAADRSWAVTVAPCAPSL